MTIKRKPVQREICTLMLLIIFWIMMVAWLSLATFGVNDPDK